MVIDIIKIDNRYFKEIELLRAFAIFAVVINHSCDDFIHTENDLILFIFAAIKGVALYGVPLFIFISGFLLSLKISD